LLFGLTEHITQLLLQENPVTIKKICSLEVVLLILF